MAIFNEILVGRFNRYLQLLTGTKAGPPTPALSTEITPAIDLNRVRPEDRVLFGVDSYYIAASNGPNAAAVTAVRLRNPATSGVIATVHFIAITESLADTFPQITIGKIATDLSTSSFVTALDPRSGSPTSQKNSALRISSQTGVGVPGGQTVMFVTPLPANGFLSFIVFEEQMIPLLPGFAIQMTTQTQNVLLVGMFGWIERPIEDSEHPGFQFS